MTASSPSAARAAVDQLEGLLAGATPGPWVDDLAAITVPGVSEIPVVATDYGVCRPGDTALIVAMHRHLPHLLAAIKAVDELADELERQSTDAAERRDHARENGNAMSQSVNARHARVAAHAALDIRAALALAAVDVTETADGAS